MEDFFLDLTRGNLTEVKVVLASVVLGLAVYQVVLMAIGYGKLRPSFLGAGPATWMHRAAGDAIVAVTLVVAAMCVSYFEIEDGQATLHAIAACALIGVLAVKIAVVRRFRRFDRVVPFLGASVLLLFGLTWLTSAGDFLGIG